MYDTYVTGLKRDIATARLNYTEQVPDSLRQKINSPPLVQRGSLIGLWNIVLGKCSAAHLNEFDIYGASCGVNSALATSFHNALNSAYITLAVSFEHEPHHDFTIRRVWGSGFYSEGGLELRIRLHEERILEYMLLTLSFVARDQQKPALKYQAQAWFDPEGRRIESGQQTITDPAVGLDSGIAEINIPQLTARMLSRSDLEWATDLR